LVPVSSVLAWPLQLCPSRAWHLMCLCLHSVWLFHAEAGHCTSSRPEALHYREQHHLFIWQRGNPTGGKCQPTPYTPTAHSHQHHNMMTRYSCLSPAGQNVCLAPLTTPLAFPCLFFFTPTSLLINGVLTATGHLAGVLFSQHVADCRRHLLWWP
jgi:hypothetical protein